MAGDDNHAYKQSWSDLKLFCRCLFPDFGLHFADSEIHPINRK